MVYTISTTNGPYIRHNFESFKAHKGTNKATIQGLENNFMNISKIFLKILSKFYSLNVLGIDQIGSMLRPYSLVSWLWSLCGFISLDIKAYPQITIDIYRYIYGVICENEGFIS